MEDEYWDQGSLVKVILRRASPREVLAWAWAFIQQPCVGWMQTGSCLHVVSGVQDMLCLAGTLSPGA